MSDNWPRILLGLLVLLLVDQLSNYIPPTLAPEDVETAAESEWFMRTLAAKGFVLVFFAAAAGGFIARRHFLLPAMALVGTQILYQTVTFSLRSYNTTVELLNEIGESTTIGEHLWPAIWFSLPWLGGFLAATATGAMLGMRLAQNRLARRDDVSIDE